MLTKLRDIPSKPISDECQNAYRILSSAHDGATSFLDIFKEIRKTRKAKGTPTNEEQNLLRAMLIFATAGLDSMVKQLIRDALPSIVDLDVGAGEIFKRFIERRLLKGGEVNRKFLAGILGDIQPRKRVVNELVSELTSDSLQSVEQLMQVAEHFNVPSNKIFDDPKPVALIFKARNEIAHEMDIDFAHPNRNRRSRATNQMTNFTNEIFKISAAFLSEIDSELGKAE